MSAAVALLIAAKLLNVCVPIVLKVAVDSLAIVEGEHVMEVA